MNSDLLVSIIVPVFNVYDYLSECVESLINQTYKHIEIILIENGSTDGSEILCDEFSKQYDFIRVIHTPSNGLSCARNVGVAEASGEYICFVDSDDCVLPVFVEKLLNLALSNKCLISECFYEKFYDEICPITINHSNSEKIIFLNSDQWMTETNHNGFSSTVVWNKIYNRQLFNNIKFPDGRVYEDDSTTYKLVYCSGRVVRTYEKLYYYRQRKTSITGTKLSEKKIKDNIIAIKEQISFFEQNGKNDICDFVKSKLCLLFLGYYCKKVSFEDNNKNVDFIRETRDVYKTINKKRNIPRKYKVYIRAFLICPKLSRFFLKNK